MYILTCTHPLDADLESIIYMTESLEDATAYHDSTVLAAATAHRGFGEVHHTLYQDTPPA